MNKIPTSVCSVCGYEMNSSENAINEESPLPGDYSICFKCGNIAKFEDALKIVSCTKQELIELRENDYELWSMLQVYSLKCKELNKQNN